MTSEILGVVSVWVTLRAGAFDRVDTVSGFAACFAKASAAYFAIPFILVPFIIIITYYEVSLNPSTAN